MIARLKGLVDSVGDNWAVIDVGGVGYLVSCSARTLGCLPRIGEATALHIETQLRAESLQLFGFADIAERDWFRTLLNVQGVGGKVALAILSALSAEDLSRAIAAGDKASLSRAQGVGPKLAARLVTELKDKVPALAAVGIAAQIAASQSGGALSEAVSALVNLGYRPIEAEAAVARAAAQLGDGAVTAALVRAGLRELGRERAS